MEVTNQIRMKILKDGTISVDTDSFTEEVHLQAENIISETFELAGGERKVVDTKRHEQHTHTHAGGHVHGHN